MLAINWHVSIEPDGESEGNSQETAGKSYKTGKPIITIKELNAVREMFINKTKTAHTCADQGEQFKIGRQLITPHQSLGTSWAHTSKANTSRCE